MCHTLSMGIGRATRATTASAFGEVLRRHRTQQQLSQEQLATATSLHRTSISLFERGLKSPSLHTMLRVATALHLDPRDLLSDIIDLLEDGVAD
jgi:transcriptional regulator with XRE-family HTH domain